MTAGLPPAALHRAQQLACIVHGDGSARDVANLLEPLDVGDLYALAVSLAALVDIDRPLTDLLAWYEIASGNKRCRDCGQWLPVAQFARDRSRPDGLNTYCRPCHSQRQRARYEQRKLDRDRDYAQRHGMRQLRAAS